MAVFTIETVHGSNTQQATRCGAIKKKTTTHTARWIAAAACEPSFSFFFPAPARYPFFFFILSRKGWVCAGWLSWRRGRVLYLEGLLDTGTWGYRRLQPAGLGQRTPNCSADLILLIFNLPDQRELCTVPTLLELASLATARSVRQRHASSANMPKEVAVQPLCSSPQTGIPSVRRVAKLIAQPVPLSRCPHSGPVRYFFTLCVVILITQQYPPKRHRTLSRRGGTSSIITTCQVRTSCRYSTGTSPFPPELHRN